MSDLESLIKKFRDKSFNLGVSAVTTSSSLVVAGCGGGSSGSEDLVSGFPSFYVGPEPNYEAPTLSDPYFETLKSSYIQPYWLSTLEMDAWEDHISPMVEDFERVIHFTFPDVQPSYNHFGIAGWEPATEQVKIATRDILYKFEDILDITFTEVNDSDTVNVITVGLSIQSSTAGVSYFPNYNYKIGMDVFIAKGYANPQFISDLTTNYDYEVLVHELGHAIGLKHPFEASGTNLAILSTFEDNTANTAMSYEDNPATFNGSLRPLDWMTLTKFYGVKKTYNPDDDIYSFNDSGGTFIIDGAGIDTISVADTLQDVSVDLRPGAHSYLGGKSIYISSPNQLTISHGSDIENVETGSGNDNVIGTELNNIIITGEGDDIIFAGGGVDIINSGTGNDHVDLSEELQSRDTVKLNTISVDSGFDTIYGFVQGAFGDILDLSEITNSVAKLFPLVTFESTPVANFSSGILMLTGADFTSVTDLEQAFNKGEGLETLSMSDGASTVIIHADSQETGADQRVFSAKSWAGEISVTQLAILQGNALDIDQWHADNFIFTA